MAGAGYPELRATELSTLQVNLGKLCNQACKHCHVDSGPHRTEPEVNMSAETADVVLDVLGKGGFHTVDLTGGAPEMNPNFRRIAAGARELGIRVIDRCNLTVLSIDGQEDLAEFLAEHGIEISASLPHYALSATDRQRGAGVFDASIEGLRKLNALGYGNPDSGLVLNLVHNPTGAFLPGDQVALESDFRRQLDDRFGIQFNNLYCITNMPVRRYLEWLERSGNLESYMQLLLDAFNPGAVEGLMCRNLISVAPDGSIYDCDFNQMCEMPIDDDGGKVPQRLQDFDRAALETRRIVAAEHCLGCTAGAGSSCGGTVAAETS